MILSEREAEVIERMRANMGTTAIAEDLGIAKSTASLTIQRLVKKSAVKNEGLPNIPVYKVLIDTYDIEKNHDTTPQAPASSPIPVHVPKEHAKFIRANYSKMPRRELAKRLNMDKVTLNRMILQLGLGGL
ncbi:helix-turn-helix transcriptional regulator [Cohnella sp. GCM10020058]|uniref:helix-turn-helix transcriptional regulator n=1 Tax=Cohnella sp. GCM10020058 TaxID=3317330 RepID=UPI00363899A9